MQNPEFDYHNAGYVSEGTPCMLLDAAEKSLQRPQDPLTPQNAYIFPKATLKHLRMRQSIDTSLAMGKEQGNDRADSCYNEVKSNILELWKASQETVENNGRFLVPRTVDLVLSSRDTTKSNARLTCDQVSPQSIHKTPSPSIDETFEFDQRAEPRSSKRLSRSRKYSDHHKDMLSTPSNPAKSIYRNAKSASIQHLQNLLDSAKVDIVNGETNEVYVKNVSLHMLLWFCGERVIASRLSSNSIMVPSTHASKDGIVRVIRYMRRWCLNASIRPTGELRTPPTTKEAISTFLACRFFNLDADAQHMENLVVNDFMCNPRVFIADEDVELIWCGYEGTLRETSFGDAIIWFILEHVMGGTHALADEIRWMLVQEGYEDLKARIRLEMKRAVWRQMGRMGFLEWCSLDRAQRRATGESEITDSDQALDQPYDGEILAKDKPLPCLPSKAQGPATL